MKNYAINCGKINETQPEEVIYLSWGEEESHSNLGYDSNYKYFN
jgi:hypothetical protein